MDALLLRSSSSCLEWRGECCRRRAVQQTGEAARLTWADPTVPSPSGHPLAPSKWVPALTGSRYQVPTTLRVPARAEFRRHRLWLLEVLPWITFNFCFRRFKWS